MEEHEYLERFRLAILWDEFRRRPFPVKNLSHLLAGGDYVVNLDADTFIGTEGIARMLSIFEQILTQC